MHREEGDGRGAVVHQVDSRTAAVNTNNGEYRSVNCVLGFVEGGCASVMPISLPPPPHPAVASHLRVVLDPLIQLALSRELFSGFLRRNRGASRCDYARVPYACVCPPTDDALTASSSARPPQHRNQSRSYATIHMENCAVPDRPASLNKLRAPAGEST